MGPERTRAGAGRTATPAPARTRPDRAPRARIFGAVQVASGIIALGLLLLPPAVWLAADEGWIYILMLLPPAVLSGAAFPLAVRMVVDDPALAGTAAGRMTAVNTLGGIAGSLLIGFVALPHLGLQASVRFTTGLALASGFAAWGFLDRRTGWGPQAAAISACVLVWATLPRLLGTQVPQDFLAEAIDARRSS